MAHWCTLFEVSNASTNAGYSVASYHHSVPSHTETIQLPFVLKSLNDPPPEPDVNDDFASASQAVEGVINRLSTSNPTPQIEVARAICRMLLGLDEATRVFGEAQRRLTSLRGSNDEILALVRQLLNEGSRSPEAHLAMLPELPLTLGTAAEGAPVPAVRLVEPDSQPRLVVRLLGRFEVAIDGRPLPVWRSRRARQLFEFLLLNRRDEINRHRLTGLFWPDYSEERAENNLSLAVMALRRQLQQGLAGDAHTLIGFKAGCYFVDTSCLNLDVDDFESAVTFARRAQAEGDLTNAVRWFDEAISLYRGDLLPGEIYEDWTLGWRRSLQDLFAEALQHRAGLARQTNDHNLSIQLNHRLLELDPASEATHRQLIRDYVAIGQRSRAVQQAKACRAALLRHLGVEPDAETRSVFELAGLI
jgi:DNA-binding SARP family transcriptional activator